MGLFKRFLKPILKNKQEKGTKDTEESKFMPEQKLPTDENFMGNFKKNGGKFLYCSDQTEILSTFDRILKENHWDYNQVFCFKDNLKNMFGGSSHYSTSSTVPCFLTTCEYLIADTGALLISSNQIGEKKLKELPSNFIVFATTSQLIDTIGEGLRGIKSHQQKIPSNITTIKTFEDNQESDFMSYGSTSKNLYLLLLEDL